MSGSKIFKYRTCRQIFKYLTWPRYNCHFPIHEFINRATAMPSRPGSNIFKYQTWPPHGDLPNAQWVGESQALSAFQTFVYMIMMMMMVSRNLCVYDNVMIMMMMVSIIMSTPFIFSNFQILNVVLMIDCRGW